MKKTILSIAVIAAAFVAASCQKENLQENTASEGSASVFTATIETVAGTKTTVERVDGTPATYKTKWDNGDEIGINGTIFTATPASDATKATFTKKNTGDAEPSGPFMAYFPKDLFIQIKGPMGIMSLPPTYPYVEGKYNMPMYAESDNTTLSFKNLCGVLAITVSGADFTSVSSIEVSSDQQMNGAFTATAEGVLSFESKTLEDADKKVTLNFDTAKSIESAGSATFYIPVPAGTHNPLAIKVTSGSTTNLMVTKKSGGVAVARNTVYPIAFKPTTGTATRTGNIEVNWVQLWENGPKFAEYNVGAANNKAKDYGGYYCWGGSVDKDPYGTFNDGTVVLSGDKDTATKLWGSNWRMPTEEELDALSNTNNCTCTWTPNYNGTGVNGLLCTGKTEPYASNSVFLPAAGYYTLGSVSDQDSDGYYWSSKPFNLGAFYLFFNYGYQGKTLSDKLDYGYSVRAVLAK